MVKEFQDLGSATKKACSLAFFLKCAGYSHYGWSEVSLL